MTGIFSRGGNENTNMEIRKGLLNLSCWAVDGDRCGGSLKGSENGSLTGDDDPKMASFDTLNAEITPETVDFFVSDAEGDLDCPSEGFSSIDEALDAPRNGKDEAGTVAIKTVELDAALGGRAVQYREVQGHETEKFLSYFKPCIIPQEGGAASGFKHPVAEEHQTRLFVCKGKHVVHVKEAVGEISKASRNEASGMHH